MMAEAIETRSGQGACTGQRSAVFARSSCKIARGPGKIVLSHLTS